MLIRSHEVFVLPESRTTLWRYMDFTKFVSLLETRSLVFPRIDQFKDPYEGLAPEAAVREYRTTLAASQIPLDVVNLWINFWEITRKQLYVSCWCASECESAAMWKLFLSGDEGIAIRSNTDALADVLEACDYRIGMSSVQYIDYETTSISFRNALAMVMHKRRSFAHEQEFRAVVWSKLGENKLLIEDGAPHVSVTLDPAKLIEAIHVSPDAPLWFGELVEKIAGKYAVQAPVIRSSLYQRPVY